MSLVSFAFTGMAGAADSPATSLPGAPAADGTFYAGTSPKTYRPFYATPTDAPAPANWKDATAYCETLEASGHADWRLPTKEELDTLYQNREEGSLKNSFGSDWYWSSTPNASYVGMVWQKKFSSGVSEAFSEVSTAAVRCVRS
jgi:hypothetical protein